MSEFNEVTYDVLLRWLGGGQIGASIESLMKSYIDSGTDGDYTVYWPRDSVRVIHGADYATARAIACILRDERTRWMGKPTTIADPILSRIRRPLQGGSNWASNSEAVSAPVYKKDRILAGDISVRMDDSFDDFFDQAQFPGSPYRFDYSTLPED